MPDEDIDYIGYQIGLEVMEAVRKWDNSRARSLQSEKRILGMSQLGGCREYIRAEIANDPKVEPVKVKWAAVIGTAVGDMVENAMTQFMPDVSTQGKITVKLPRLGISVSGSTDARIGRKRLVDFKTKDGTGVIRTEGAPLKELIQISGYLIGAVQQGEMDEGATAHLVYLDRSGKEKEAYVVNISYEQALTYIAIAEERLDEVAVTLAAGQSQVYRDQPESLCWHTQCPFYNACWPAEGYDAEGVLTEPADELVELYDKGRELQKVAKNMMETAIHSLHPDEEHRVEGQGKRLKLKWTYKARRSDGEMYPTIDVRIKR